MWDKYFSILIYKYLKIIFKQDICRCCVFYAHGMSRRLESITKHNKDDEMFGQLNVK